VLAPSGGLDPAHKRLQVHAAHLLAGGLRRLDKLKRVAQVFQQVQ
jgi:hypothetical protein